MRDLPTLVERSCVSSFPAVYGWIRWSARLQGATLLRMHGFTDADSLAKTAYWRDRVFPAMAERPSVRGGLGWVERANFKGLVLGCIEAKFCE